MAIVPNFSTSQVLGLPNSITLTDTSTGTDAAVVSRRVFMQTAANDYLVEVGTTSNYEEWIVSVPGALNPLSIAFDVLNKDYALYITVQWLNSANIILYSKQYLLGFTLYNEAFDYQLTQVLSGNPLVINDHNFFPNKSDLRVNIDAGNQAIYFATDIFAAQQCYDRATNFRLNSPYFFNANV